MSTNSTKRAAFAVLQFLRSSTQDGSIRADDAEGIEVASQCISEAFGVDLDSDSDSKAYAIAPETLVSVLEKHAATAAKSTPSSAEASSSKGSSEQKTASAADKVAAEKAKSSGNQLMAAKKYDEAIKAYGEAISHDPNNAVYWSNRAAAYSQLQDHASAIEDARQAIKIDASFSKAYSRLGHALFSSGEYEDAVGAYEKGLELDPNNAVMKSSLATAKSRIPTTSADDGDDDDDEASPSAAATRGAPGGGAGGIPGFPGMGGGMPNLSSLMNNPAIMNMCVASVLNEMPFNGLVAQLAFISRMLTDHRASQMMQNGGLERLMSNPAMRSMMEGAGGAGGGMPDLNALMSDPTMRQMAEQFGRSMGGAGAGGAGSGGNNNNNNNNNMYS